MKARTGTLPRALAGAACAALTAAGAAVLAPGTAHACAVCFGAIAAPITHGLNNGILFLLGVIGAVQIGFVGLFVAIRRRARTAELRRDDARPSNGGDR